MRTMSAKWKYTLISHTLQIFGSAGDLDPATKQAFCFALKTHSKTYTETQVVYR